MTRWITRERSLKLILVLLSFIIAIGLSEAILRMVFPKSDIIPAEPEKDPVLGHRILPGQSGHDERGFRNDSAKGDFPIFCIGDSFTYGNGVSRRHAMPQQLGRILNVPVYNMGMGGYGPVQYYHLIGEAKKMGAKKIIISFFLGNDVTDAFSMSRYPYWESLHQGCSRDRLPAFEPCSLPYETNDPVYWEPDLLTIQLKSKDSLLWRTHSFLRVQSVFYALTYEFALKPAVQAVFEKEKHKSQKGTFYAKPLDIVFRPPIYLSAVDLRNHQVRCGVQVIFEVIKLMADKYQDKENFLFVLIPTKESVYREYFRQNKTDLPASYECEIYYERIIAGWIQEELSKNGFRSLDLLPEMRKAADGGRLLLYPASSDDHPNVVGYGNMAKQVAQAIAE